MRWGMGLLTPAVALVLLYCSAIGQTLPPPAGAPSILDEETDNPRGNVHLTTALGIPLNPMAAAVHPGIGLGAGAGYNFTRRHGVVGEFMWNYLLPTAGAMSAIRTAVNDPAADANVHLFTITGNYRYELRGKTLGTYLMGGGGLYYRYTNFSKEVTTGQQIPCTPTWLWWGFTCTSDMVTAHQNMGSWTAAAGGVNGGIGFTARIGPPPYRLFVESRYHYAPNSHVNVQLINLAFGIRY